MLHGIMTSEAGGRAPLPRRSDWGKELWSIEYMVGWNVIRLEGPQILRYKGLVINYGEEGGGSTKWENRGYDNFCTPPLKTR